MVDDTIKQTDKEFPACFHEACYFMAILFMLAVTFSPNIFTHEKIIDIYKQSLSSGIIDSHMTVLNPQKLIDNVAGINRMLFRGKFEASYPTASDEREILCWHKEGNTFDHFCYGNGKNINLYDSWPGGADSVKNGNVISKRIFKVV